MLLRLLFFAEVTGQLIDCKVNKNFYITKNLEPTICRIEYNSPLCAHGVTVANFNPCDSMCKEWGCDLNLLANGVCDSQCRFPVCGYDQGDCYECAPGCTFEMLTNDVCDPACTGPQCNGDKGHCPLCSSPRLWPCYEFQINNGVCETACNVAECQFDGKDCLRGCAAENIENGVCNFECAHMFLERNDCTKPCAPGCPYTKQYNYQCDIDCAVPACNMDNGYCSSVQCAPGCRFAMRGNYHCDAACFNPACRWDYGDCVSIMKGVCAPGCTDSMKVGSHCDQECNNEFCGFDNGACSTTFGNKDCAPECPYALQWGNQVCDGGCNSAVCNWDNLYCVSSKQTVECAPDCNFGLLNNAQCDPECNTRSCSFDSGKCRCLANCDPAALTLQCKYDNFGTSEACFSEFQVRVAMYYQIIQGNYDAIFDNSTYIGPNSCEIEDLQTAFEHSECVPKCNTSGGMYSMGMCAEKLPANCTVGWGPEAGKCLECSQSKVQYLGYCLDSCPAGTDNITIISHMCANSSLTSNTTHPAEIFVREDKRESSFDGKVYPHFTDALAGVWDSHTIIWLIGDSATYDMNMRFSGQSSNYFASMPKLFTSSRCLNLTIQSRPCSIGNFAGCSENWTTLHLHNPAPFTYSKKHLTFKNVVLTSRSRFEFSATKYCPHFHQSGHAIFDDREAIQDSISPYLLQCSQFANFSLFVLQKRARLFLEVKFSQNVRFEDFTLQYKSIITLEDGNLTLTNVDFVNVHLNGGVVILQTRECPNLNKSCGYIVYRGGTVAYLNNGFEVKTEAAYGSFLHVLNSFVLNITAVTFQYNIASTVLISVIDSKTVQISNCTFYGNVALGGVLAMEFSWKLNPGSDILYVAHLAFLRTFSRAPLVQLTFALSPRPVTFVHCNFHSNTGTAISVSYRGVLNMTSNSSVNFQDVSFVENCAFSTLVQVHNYPNVVVSSCTFRSNGDNSNDQRVLHAYLDAPDTYATQETTPSETLCSSLIAMQNCSASLLSDTIISDNVCKGGGTGVAYSTAGKRHIVSNVVFTRNAGTAAAFLAGQKVSLEVRNLTAVDNRLQVVFATTDSRVEFLDSVFQGNWAATGCIAAKSSLNITVLRCRFSNNEAQESDGGVIGLIADEALHTTILEVKDSTFQRNIAQNGGAISISTTIASTVQFTLANCSFASNRAAVSGSSLSIAGAITLSVLSQIDSCVFTDENSLEGAVSLAFFHGILRLSHSAFTHNSAVLAIDTSATVYLQAVTFADNSATAIVKLWRQKFSTIRTSDCRFERNTAAVDLQNALWTDSNSRISDSAATAVVLTESQAVLLGTKFQRNKSQTQGGAARVGTAAALNCTACEFLENVANLDGGAIYAAPASTVLLNSCGFLSNVADNEGAAIYAKSATIDIGSCSFVGNTAGQSATIAGVSSTVRLCSCTLRANKALRTPGLSFSAASVLTLASCDFQSQSGQEAAFLSLHTSSAAAVANSTFAAGSGFAAVHTDASTLALEECSFTGIACRNSVFHSSQSRLHFMRVSVANVSASGSIASLYAGNLQVYECKFSDYSQSGLLAERATVVIKSSTFSKGSSAVRCLQCSRLAISNSSFISNQRGAVLAEASGFQNSEVSISDCVFIWNSAERGGAVYADSVVLEVARTEFIDSFARNGGALYLTCTYSTQCSFSIAQSAFIRNIAEEAGGAIAWDSVMPALNNASFSFNTAQYGPDISSFLARASVAFLDDSSVLRGMNPGGRVPKPLIAKLYDHYGQLLVLDNSTECEMQSLDESIATVAGEKIGKAQQGVVTFGDLVVFADPKASVLLHVHSAKLRYSSFVELRMRECVPGETEQERRCILCGENSFSLDPSEPCQSCPAHSLCLGNTTVLPKPGYWRSEPSAKDASRCRNPSACLGGNSTQTISLSGLCQQGFEGYMCLGCADGYYSTGTFQCIKCPWAANVQGAGVIGAVTLAILVLARGSVRGWAKVPFLKVLINYFQTLYFVTQLNAEWPSAVADLWEGVRRLGAPIDTSVPLDCWLPFYAKVSMYATLPVTVTLAVTLPWFLFVLAKRLQGSTELLRETIMAAYFLVYPTVARAVFSLFSCTETSRLTFDVHEECWSSAHYKFMLGLGLPCLLLWVLAAPFAASRLTTQGLEWNFRHWEAVSFLRKAMMAAVCMLFTTSFRAQALTLQFIIFSSLIAHYLCWPFNDTRLNQLEFGSLLAVSIVQWCTTAIITVGPSAAWAGPIVASVCIYPCYWVWQTRAKRTVDMDDLVSKMRPATLNFECMKEVYLYSLQVPPQFAVMSSGLTMATDGKVQPALLLSK